MRRTISMPTKRCIVRDIRLSDDENILAAMDCPEVSSMHSGGFRDIPDVLRYIDVLLKEYDSRMTYEGTMRLYNGRSDEKMYAIIHTDTLP